MLRITNLHAHIQDKHILHNITMDCEPGKNYCLLGKNGSGKSSLAMSVMGHPQYKVSQGEIYIDGENVLDMDAHERAQAGIFVAFQNIPEIPGVKLFEFLRTIYSAKQGKESSFVQFKKIITPIMKDLGIDTEFLWRDLTGFSGGERRKIEIIQLKLLEPRYIFLDEVDSGLDVDAFKTVAELINTLNNENNSFIIITHYFSILDHLPIDHVYVLEQGRITHQGDVAMAHRIKEEGFSSLHE